MRACSPVDALLSPCFLVQMEGAAKSGEAQKKKVWRIAFFSRLDERKGIKIFVDAVSMLPRAKRPEFEVRAQTERKSNCWFCLCV